MNDTYPDVKTMKKYSFLVTDKTIDFTRKCLTKRVFAL